jgi:hypothetical protein
VETSNPTPQQPTGPPDEIVSSDNSPVLRTRRGGLRSISSTAWAILAVVVVLVGGVATVHWSSRSEQPPAQDASLSGFQMTIPETASSTSATSATASTGQASDRPTQSSSVQPSDKGKQDNEGTRDVGGPVAPTRGTSAAGAPADTTPQGTPATTTEQSTAPAEVPVSDNTPEVADPSVNLAASGSVQASSQLLGHAASSATDGSEDTYWESLPGFPQTLTVDLGKLTTVGRLTMALPQGRLWHGRTQMIEVQGSPDGSSFSQVSEAQSYQFGGRHGSSEVSVGLAQSQMRYLRLTFTANSEWPAAQLGQLAAYSS